MSEVPSGEASEPVAAPKLTVEAEEEAKLDAEAETAADLEPEAEGEL